MSVQVYSQPCCRKNKFVKRKGGFLGGEKKYSLKNFGSSVGLQRFLRVCFFVGGLSFFFVENYFDSLLNLSEKNPYFCQNLTSRHFPK